MKEEIIEVPKKTYNELMALVAAIKILGSGMKITPEMESLVKKLEKEGKQKNETKEYEEKAAEEDTPSLEWFFKMIPNRDCLIPRTIQIPRESSQLRTPSKVMSAPKRTPRLPNYTPEEFLKLYDEWKAKQDGSAQ